MRTNNPMLREEAFRRTGASQATMTVGGTVGKTFIMLVLLLGTAVYSYMQVVLNQMSMGVIGGAVITAAIIAFASVFFPRITPVTAPVYAAVEGVVLGSVSAWYALRFGDTLILQAVLLTIAVLFAMLLLYATRIVRVTDKFRMGVLSATLGIALMYLLSMVLQLFGVAVPFLHQGGTVGIIISAIVVVVAALNLVLDFDFIERGAHYGAPKHMEWYGALGLMLTLVWLYMEILRLVSYFTRND
ncbi:Bax inhibitor-1/YccA family protein [Ectobacillus ponti]|uniref:Bax inhibitor-1/YccA family protein n=2 Tax=Bacteria TaxID=2 RepID=A0AA42BQY3_9BACI|nr:Bax inhibitor-1/YccA family protein [Ectobacillus ponti]MCP8968934.1 Bax inhibitor-1/YccA family protein [Ectobacillus ponti]